MDANTKQYRTEGAVTPLIKMVETCGGCPSSWGGWDAEGVYYYFKFRYGVLRVDTAPTENEWQSPLSVYFGAAPSPTCRTLYEEQISDSLDGIMGYHELQNKLKDLFTFPEYCSTEE
jgi:hypothetical protein